MSEWWREFLQELVVFVGLQGSGKSTFYIEQLARTHRIVSKDLMGRSKGKEARQQQLVTQFLTGGDSVVVDNTNPSPAERAALIALGHRHGVRVIAYFFVPDVPASLARNRLRQGSARVPDFVIALTARKLVAPTRREGFDAVFHVKLDAEGYTVMPAPP